MTDLAFILRDAAADFRHQPLRHLGARLCVNALETGALEGWPGPMIYQPVRRLVHDAQGRLIGLPCRLAPAEEAMRPEHHADNMRIPCGHFADLEAEIEARALPWQITHPLA